MGLGNLDAMERKETCGTTGTRMVVRFFGGFDFTAADTATRLPAVAGYTKGVPMGGDLDPAPAGPTRRASCRPWATRSTLRPPPGPAPSACRS